MIVPTWRHRTDNPFGRIMRKHARTFTMAASFLDRDRRKATEVLYAFFRTLDDLVDERPADANIAALHNELDRWRRLLDVRQERRDPSPLACALLAVIDRYDIPPTYFLPLLDGLADDLAGRPIRTYDDLERYAFQVAGSVGLTMCHVLGATTPSALAAASALGIGMQLTNIIRDVDSDLRRGRVYLPADELAQHPGASDSLEARRCTPALRSLMRLQIERARRYYAAGALGVPELPVRVRFPIQVAIDLYAEILREVERRHHDIFAGRAVVGRRRKALLTGRVALRQLALPAASGGSAVAALGPAARAELERLGVPIGTLDFPRDNRPSLVEAS